MKLEDITDYLIFFLVIILALPGLWVIHSDNSQLKQDLNISSLGNVGDKVHIPTDQETIEQISRNISNSHEYKYGFYDCTDFSINLVKELNQSGFNASCVPGVYRVKGFNYPHTWVEVNINNDLIYIEATTGEFIDKETYNLEYRRLGNRTFCW